MTIKQLGEMWSRVPRLWLFAIVGLVQVALIALMVGDRVRVLRSGTEVKLQTRAVDPRDLLRGDYVVLNYDISQIEAPALRDTPSAEKGSVVYIKLARQADGFHTFASVHREPVAVADGEVLILGRIRNGLTCGPQSKSYCLQINYGLESFFVPQGEGREIEKARNQGKVAVIASVAPGGRAAIKRLLLDGKPVYDEPLF